jgi:hypothetical protein
LLRGTRDGRAGVDAREGQPDDESGDLFQLPSAIQRSENSRRAAGVADELSDDVQGCRVVAAHGHGRRRLAVRARPLSGGKQRAV